MSDDIEIRSGGMVAVDTAALEDAASQLDAVTAACDRAVHALARARALVLQVIYAVGDAAGFDDPSNLEARAAAAAEHATALAVSLRTAADLYRYADLCARRSFAVGDDVGEIDAELARLEARYPRIGELLEVHLRGRGHEILGPLVTRTWATSLISGPSFVPGWLPGIGMMGAVSLVGAGTVATDERLRGSAPQVSVRESSHTPASAPTSVASAVRRIPGGTAPVRVERYTMADGTRQWALYVAGTRSAGVGGADPFDMGSNHQLYSGQRSASYQGVVEALAAAGVRPGEPVHAVGHSQGAMIVSRLALEGEVTVATVVTAGSPIEARVGDDTVSVVLRHRDDPVAALAGGGFSTPVGALGGFVVERETHAPIVATDPLAAHHLEAYVDTARLVDAADDPRVSSVRRVLDDLGSATSVDAFEYEVRRG